MNGGLKVTFEKEDSFFFNLAGVVVQEIDDQISLAEKIIALYREGKWKKQWHIVTGVMCSSSTTILGSDTGNQSVLLEAKNQVPVIDLQSAELQLAISGAQQLAYKMVSAKGAIPLFKLSRLKYKLFRGLEMGMTEDEDDLDEIREMSINDVQDLNEVFGLKEVSVSEP